MRFLWFNQQNRTIAIVSSKLMSVPGGLFYLLAVVSAQASGESRQA